MQNYYRQMLCYGVVCAVKGAHVLLAKKVTLQE